MAEGTLAVAKGGVSSSGMRCRLGELLGMMIERAREETEILVEERVVSDGSSVSSHRLEGYRSTPLLLIPAPRSPLPATPPHPRSPFLLCC
ncbi:hypothetical protein OsI_25889 [Oryza sativa Indica Group]|uniref:Uncharacterized protein n=1 Tax=Oryza sativa subsp. indica TaxID=39946 RepID=B8B5S3_ORYSI|nr:hypothetical protein OsI_25889 [Oryza sativa Indica Group]